MPHEETSANHVPALASVKAAAGSPARWPRLALLPASAVGLAAAATLVQEFRAPVMLFPLVLGLLLGAAAELIGRGGEARELGNGQRLAAALLLAVSWHYFSYLQARRAAEEDHRKRPAIAQAVLEEHTEFGPPRSFLEHLRRETARGRPVAGGHVRGFWLWLWWAGETILIATACSAVPWLWRGRGGRQWRRT